MFVSLPLLPIAIPFFILLVFASLENSVQVTETFLAYAQFTSQKLHGLFRNRGLLFRCIKEGHRRYAFNMEENLKNGMTIYKKVFSKKRKKYKKREEEEKYFKSKERQQGRAENIC